MKTLVIYHGGCPDGFCSAWACADALGKDNVELLAARYGDDPPDVRNRTVYVVDFSYKRDVMLRMAEDAADITVLDHHKTAQAELEGLDFCHFDANESGASLTWRWLHASAQELPWLVRYVRDRDLWLWELADSLAVSARVMATPHVLEAWDALAKMPLGQVAAEGSAIRLHIDKHVETTMQLAFDVEIDDLRARAVNAGPSSISDILGKMCEKGASAAIGFFWGVDGWEYSLRSRGDEHHRGVDVSAIAARRGGGGHRNAAGFGSGRDLIPEIALAMKEEDEQ